MKNDFTKIHEIVSSASWGLGHSIEKMEDLHAWGIILEEAGKELKKFTKKEFEKEFGR